MALENFTVRRIRKGSGAGDSRVNYDSVTMAINLDNISIVLPSVCDKDGISDGLVNAEVWVNTGGVGAGEYGKLVKFWVTQTVATIEALDD